MARGPQGGVLLSLVFIAGGTGYMGRRLIPQLLQHGFTVRALVRPGSETKLSPGCEPVRGDVLNSESYIDKVFPAETFVHLVGVSHPNPSKAQRFRSIDLVSLKALGEKGGVGGWVVLFFFFLVC